MKVATAKIALKHSGDQESVLAATILFGLTVFIQSDFLICWYMYVLKYLIVQILHHPDTASN